ncbi:MAG: TIGR03619 family F420-dependent LLM class oxidoreductase [Acidimicrobiales bacterium]|nr:TIGR03619 family F420-dependent LLM class oxidoreductase [Acidimicrobiales bacterium]
MAGIIPSGALVHGLQLPIQSQSTLYAEGWEATAGVDELTAIARTCDDAGFFYVAVCDHVAIPKPYDERMGTEWWDTMTTLGYLAGITSRVHLLSHVYVLPYRHPLMAAKAFLTLDSVSKGRAIMGVGAGHLEPEFALLGRSFADRGRELDEGIDVVRAAFGDEYPSYTGSRYEIANAGLRPRPYRPGGPPIWVGGSSPAAIRRAATRGDGWLPQGPPKIGLKAAIRELRALREAAGRGDEPFDVGVNTEPVFIGKPQWDVGPHCLAGSAQRIAERLRSYGEIGVNQLQIRFRSRSAAELTEQIEAFGRDVAPLLAD